MVTVNTICNYLEAYAPAELAESWDNTGLLVGDRTHTVDRLMTCLTITPESVTEAIDRQANMIVSHHPLMFRPIQQITADTPAGKMLLDLIQNQIAVYSPHTSFDSTHTGINDSIAQKLGLVEIVPIKPLTAERSNIGAGRIGCLPEPAPASQVANSIKGLFSCNSLGVVGHPDRLVAKIGIACGSGGSFLATVHQLGADLFVTGEADFHTCLQAKALDTAMLLLGHFTSERFALENLAERMRQEFPLLEIWASNEESDPIVRI
ncbi:MAG TPA: Nif3-like dinuclear metal center hexameric protein [Pirellulaceae bacterium]|nr:Nif3-like dinuclear metal center hexameric protein [Pirellulaceae bacterium]HMO91114.1 Nif3-like dinuclear metal center hexameric protein [Pirellulaceae bacterium]HMP70539.1 Nif3-like dinuclear metal center hexameric protein [Pirellulaceae bacterium]